MLPSRSRAAFSRLSFGVCFHLVSDLFGLSARRMLRALADGEADPAALAALGDRRLHASQEQLCDALGAATTLKSTYRRLVGMALDELQLLERHMSKLDQEMADLLSSHQDAVQRLAEVPGLGVESAHQIIAEVGAAARTFPSEKHLASWIGVCPGEQESAGVSAPRFQTSNLGDRSPTIAVDLEDPTSRCAL
jgi:transposase